MDSLTKTASVPNVLSDWAIGYLACGLALSNPIIGSLLWAFDWQSQPEKWSEHRSNFTNCIYLEMCFLLLNPPCTLGVFPDKKKFANYPNVVSVSVIAYLWGSLAPSIQTILWTRWLAKPARKMIWAILQILYTCKSFFLLANPPYILDAFPYIKTANLPVLSVW